MIEISGLQELMHLRLGRSRLLSTNEGIQPGKQKEYLSFAFDLRQYIESRLQEWLG